MAARLAQRGYRMLRCALSEYTAFKPAAFSQPRLPLCHQIEDALKYDLVMHRCGRTQASQSSNRSYVRRAVLIRLNTALSMTGRLICFYQRDFSRIAIYD